MMEVQKFQRVRMWALRRRRPIRKLRISRVRAKRMLIEFEKMRAKPDLLNVEHALLAGQATIYDIALSWPVAA